MDQRIERPTTTPPNPELALGLGASRRRTKRSRWLGVLALLGLLAAAWYGYTSYGNETPTVAYRTVPAEQGSLTVQVSATGTLQPLTQVDISSELSGVIRNVTVRENEEVSKDQVLAELDTTRLAAQVERAQAGVKAAQAQVSDAQTTLRESEATLKRAQSLAERGQVAPQALETATATRDRAQSSVQIAEANLAVAQADLKLQEADLAKTKIYAPIDGLVLTRSVDPGQTVAASMQAPVLFVVAEDLKRMELKATIDEADIGSIAKGQKANFTVDAFPDRSFTAAIRDIAYASATTEGVVTYEARLDVDNADMQLRPGMTATASIITREANDVLTVPNAAFRFAPPSANGRSGFSFRNLFSPGRPRGMRGGGRSRRGANSEEGRPLYVLRNGVAEEVRVIPGATDGERTEIKSGLEAGDQIILGLARQGGEGGSDEPAGSAPGSS
ncbi:efflux RND transporter periplasmic adaptor subunit [Tianweitania sp. BSSL-BM11]|uniref:Efflux RND transporter periplasmic adaptor subunit n=1 Tax=Tianweitania aestuarii TaxID=2814886 RepID=A0ABS5RXA5_9HYPH|nr:efflux RND transporter periplasmic adaptor subunit [Tianweitania aestuarii]MBS9720854.1 efflux RND transporter periplasmic adaptor subunit [Tianweitania aestuarii]